MNLRVETKKDLLFIEDFDEEHDPDFVKLILNPYLEDLYQDLKLRVQKGKPGLTKTVF